MRYELTPVARRGLQKLRRFLRQYPNTKPNRKGKPMKRVDAHGVFAAMQDQGRVDQWPEEFRAILDGPVGMTALVEVSGQLDDADSEAALMEAAAHGDSLMTAGVVSFADFEQATRDCTRDLIAWGEAVERRISEHIANN